MSKILLVDDDDGVRATVSGFFRSRADELQAASSVQDALALLQSERFDLIVTDLFMGSGDGIELIGKIRTIDPLVPIILITGGGEIFPQGSRNLANLTDIAHFMGACHVLYKPFRQNTFLSLVDAVLADGTSAPAIGAG